MGKMKFGNGAPQPKITVSPLKSEVEKSQPIDRRLNALEQDLYSIKKEMESFPEVSIISDEKPEIPVKLLDALIKKNLSNLKEELKNDIAVSDEKIQELHDECVGEFHKISEALGQHAKVIDRQGDVLVASRAHSFVQDKKRKRLLKRILKPIKKDKLTYAALGLAALSLLLQLYGG